MKQKQSSHYEPRLDERSPYDTFLDDLVEMHRLKLCLPRASTTLDECILDFQDAQDVMADDLGISPIESFNHSYDAHIAGSTGENLAITLFFIIDKAAKENISLSYFLKLYRRRRENLKLCQPLKSPNL